MITINNSKFNAEGADRKAAVYGITLSGSEDVVIKDCEFENVGYSAILNNSTGNVTIENCNFACNNIYNPIEGSQSVDNGNVTIKNCVFNGAPGNNYINFYQFANNSEHEISNCYFAPTCDNNVMRISNRTNAKAVFNVKNCEYNYVSGTPSDYTAFLLCQDYTSKNGKSQDFTNIELNLENLKCNNKIITTDGPEVGSIFYIYEDGKGLITGENDPQINIK